MRALRRQGGVVGVAGVPVPSPGPGEVRVRIELAGVCRTDLQVARGELPAADPVTLGHELAGTVDAVGRGADAPPPGAPVAVMPLLPDGTMLGVHRDGAFAEYVVVPASAVHRVPPGTPWAVAAYAEPVAAALAVTTIGLRPGERVCVMGRGRIARLIEGVLRARGADRVVVDPAPPDAAFDVVVETTADADVLGRALRAVRRRGRIVVRSRAPVTLTLDLQQAIEREAALFPVRYGDFAEAIELLTDGELPIEPLLGPVRPLEAFPDLVTAADEAVKTFLSPR
jgi:threonine dehydrogenase-like Zn-dependent dehydrogenase